ncbi:MAG: fibronectin type III domain-containing protein, partial [Gemmatimonadetes bacterium]|nr:fibronectin type III domain-containing protein [Gemmatimonadota bacterium]
MASISRFSLIYCFALVLGLCSFALAQDGSSGYIDDVGSTAEEFFDARTGNFEDWLQREDRIDWDADGDFDFDDFHMLQWFASDESEDANEDNFLDEDDFTLFHWLVGEEAADLNADGKMDAVDHALYMEANGVFENAGFFVLLEPDSDRVVVEWETSQPGYNDTMRYRAVGETDWQKVHKGGTPGESDPFAHLIRLTGLLPDTDYEFGLRSISADGLSTPPHEDDYEGSFRTRGETDTRRGAILN